jgi:hypothetical protein
MLTRGCHWTQFLITSTQLKSPQIIPPGINLNIIYVSSSTSSKQFNTVSLRAAHISQVVHMRNAYKIMFGKPEVKRPPA